MTMSRTCGKAFARAAAYAANCRRACSVRGVLPLRPCQTNTKTPMCRSSAAFTTLRSECRSCANGAVAPGVHMLETSTASKPASCETFIRAVAAFGFACFIASSPVATSRRWPGRTSPGFGMDTPSPVVVAPPVEEPPEVEPAPSEVVPAAPVTVLSLPPRSVKAIAMPATAAAPSRARTGPFHLMGSGTYPRLRLRNRGEPARRPAEAAAGQVRRLHLPRRTRPGPLRRKGEVAAPTCAQLLPGRRGWTPRDRAAAGSCRRHRGHRHGDRGRGAPPGAEPRQAPPAALQRAAPRRQVVPVYRRHGR